MYYQSNSQKENANLYVYEGHIPTASTESTTQVSELADQQFWK